MPVLLLLAAAIGCIVMPAAAHAPTNITITYNPDMHKLFVTVTHPVDDPATHYLRSVQVRINGRVISDPPYTSQPSRTAPVYSYDVKANPGDSVWVTATCVKGGSLEAHTEITRPVIPTVPVYPSAPVTTVPPVTATTIVPSVTGTTYAPAGLLPLIGAAALVVLVRRRA